MKYFCLLFALAIFCGCSQNKININGTVGGMANVTVSLKDGSGQTLTGVNLTDGKFKIESSGWSNPDYGTLTLSQAGKDSDIVTELYLEPGDYTVNYNKDHPRNYPNVSSISATQNELTEFRHQFDRMTDDANLRMKLLDQKYQQAVKSKTWNDSVTALANKTELERNKLNDVGREALLAYLIKHPQSKIGLHLLQMFDVASAPVAYLDVFKKLPLAQQNSADGKALSTKLNALVHLVPGQSAPAIAGLMSNGKPVDLKAMHKKIILVEFWRAANFASRSNHQQMIKNPWPAIKNNDLGIVSVSFDKKRDWWLGSMRDDKLTWPQVSDLKGTDSPNFDNWAIEGLPAYFLLDGAGRIVESNLQFEEIGLTVDKYLASLKR